MDQWQRYSFYKIQEAERLQRKIIVLDPKFNDDISAEFDRDITTQSIGSRDEMLKKAPSESVITFATICHASALRQQILLF
jgi:hypothetical protein